MPSITSANVANAIVKLVAADALPACGREPRDGESRESRLRADPGASRRHGQQYRSRRSLQPTISRMLTVRVTQRWCCRISLGNAQIVLNTHAEATFQIPDVLKVLAVRICSGFICSPRVVAIAEKIETDLLNLYAGFTANTPLGTPATAVTEAFDRSGGNGAVSGKGSIQRAEVSGCRQQHVFGDASDPAFQRVSKIPAKRACARLWTGTIEKVKDFFVFRSQYVPSTGTAPNSTTHNLAFCKDAIALVVRRLPQPLPGTGAIAEYAELGNFGMQSHDELSSRTLFHNSSRLTCSMVARFCGIRSRFRSTANPWKFEQGGVGVDGRGNPAVPPSLFEQIRKSMDLRSYYKRVREAEATLTGEHVVMVSLETSEGGKAGVRTRNAARNCGEADRGRAGANGHRGRSAREFHEANREARSVRTRKPKPRERTGYGDSRAPIQETKRAELTMALFVDGPGRATIDDSDRSGYRSAGCRR